MISADAPDWSREAYTGWDPGRALLASIRDHQRASTRSGVLAAIARKMAATRHRFWAIVSGADIPLTVRIDGGLLIPHPNGIVIHPDAVIGPNCLILQQVTLGTTDGGAPRLDGHVDIGAGAKLLGDIRIGAHVLIGANAVVLDDVPAGATAVGIPARVVQGKSRTARP